MQLKWIKGKIYLIGLISLVNFLLLPVLSLLVLPEAQAKDSNKQIVLWGPYVTGTTADSAIINWKTSFPSGGSLNMQMRFFLKPIRYIARKLLHPK